MKKHTAEFLTEYGVKNYKSGSTSTRDGHPNDGKWFHRMQDGLIWSN